MLLASLVTSACSGGIPASTPTPLPPRPKVYFQSGRITVELAYTRGTPVLVDLPKTPDTQPRLTLDLPSGDLQQFSFDQGSARIPMEILSTAGSTFIIRPARPLAPGSACLVLDGPQVAPADIVYSCFQVVGQATP